MEEIKLEIITELSKARDIEEVKDILEYFSKKYPNPNSPDWDDDDFVK